MQAAIASRQVSGAPGQAHRSASEPCMSSNWHCRNSLAFSCPGKHSEKVFEHSTMESASHADTSAHQQSGQSFEPVSEAHPEVSCPEVIDGPLPVVVVLDPRPVSFVSPGLPGPQPSRTSSDGASQGIFYSRPFPILDHGCRRSGIPQNMIQQVAEEGSDACVTWPTHA